MSLENIKTPEQLSKEWFNLRLGKFTASNFADLMKSGRKKDEIFSQTAMSLIYDKISEKLTGKHKEIFGDALDWGIENERYAISLYEQSTGIKVTSVGFIPLKGYEEYCGGSPDGQIDDGKGIIEVKCPYNSTNHIWTLINNNIPLKNYSKYYTQIQLNILCTGAEYCDFISYDPRIKDDKLKIKVIRYERDDDYISKIINRLDLSIKEMNRLKEILE